MVYFHLSRAAKLKKLNIDVNNEKLSDQYIDMLYGHFIESNEQKKEIITNDEPDIDKLKLDELILHFINKILEINNMEKISNIMEFKDITRDMLLGENINNIITKYMDNFLVFYTRDKLHFYERDKLRDYPLVFLKAILGKNYRLISKKKGSNYYYSIIKNV